MEKDYLFTSESVSEGHPDKVADYISDSIVDSFLEIDNEARVAVETLVTSDTIVLAGEVRAKDKWPDLKDIAVNAVRNLGYEQKHFSWNSVKVYNYVHSQSQDIAMGVDSGAEKEEGAGDQGIMFGFAVNEAEEYMPATLYYSHKILKTLAEKRKSKLLTGLLQDAKSQVTLKYSNGLPVAIEKLVISHQHDDSLSIDDVRSLIMPTLSEVFQGKFELPKMENILINPTGRFVIGGPDGDTGLTGRKIIVDTYGGAAPHGGGAFSGKDPTKVDRSAAYMARYLAKNIVAAGLSNKCTIQLSYAIGVEKPLSLYVNLHGEEKVDQSKLEKFLLDNIDLSPAGIRKYLKLNNPIYKPTSSYGHFGRKNEGNFFTWEKVDITNDLKSL